MITPTIGRVVLVHLTHGQNEPFPALITKVWSNSCINVAGFTDDGVAFSLGSCHLVQDDEEPPVGAYAYWMPYQKAQAAKDASQ